jgi:hypothetical protein
MPFVGGDHLFGSGLAGEFAGAEEEGRGNGVKNLMGAEAIPIPDFPCPKQNKRDSCSIMKG